MSGIIEKIVYYEPAGKIHSSQWELINNPPEDYNFITTKLSKVVSNNFIFDKVRLQLLDRLIPLNYVKAQLDSRKALPPNVDMIFAYNHLIFRNIPWVVLVEWAHILVGRDLRFLPKYRKKVERLLESNYCRGIITWSEIAKKSIMQNYHPVDFGHKLQVIPHAVRSKSIKRDYNQDSIKLLLIGSSNTPEDFTAKGADVLIESFKKLRSKYKNLKLTVRATIPKNLESTPGLTVIENIISDSKLDSLFRDADIFVLPSCFPQEMVLVEAMSYGLPVLTSWIGSTCGEYVKNNIDGSVLPRPSGVNYFVDNLILASETILRPKVIKSARVDVDILTKYLEELIENPKLREKLGKNAKNEVDKGIFSIEHRNKLLKEILTL